jgi:cell division transport system permease protein
MLGVLLISAKKISDYVRENIGFTIFFKDEVKDEAVERLGNYLNASSYVKSARFIHKDSAAAEFQKAIGEEFIKFIGTNPIHHSFEVKLKAAYANPDSIQWINKQISDFDFVEEFRYHETFLKEMSDNARYIAFAMGILAAIMLLIALALINNTIRLSIYSKRFLIKTMQLVGATSGFIRTPFLLNGIWHGILSAFIANMILWAGIFISVKKVPDLQEIADPQMLLFLFTLVFVFGILISGISTFFAVRKYLRLSSEELYE